MAHQEASFPPNTECTTESLTQALQATNMEPCRNAMPRPQRGRILGDKAFGPWTSIEEFLNRREIARGRGCSIQAAFTPTLGLNVAIKAYIIRELSESTYVHIRREASLIRNIRHDAICNIFGAFEDQSYVYIVMELCSRGDLMEHLNGRNGIRRLPEPKAAEMVLYPVLSALKSLHAQGVVHRDIKPENIFLDNNGKVKLGDFGLGINQLHEPPMSQLGTLDYMAPEVFRKSDRQAALARQPNYNEKVDVWGCGVLAYEVVTGEPPFHAEKHGSLTADLIRAGKVPIGGRWPIKVSPELSDFIGKALSKDPNKRPSAAELLEHPWIVTHVPLVAAETRLASRSSALPCTRSSTLLSGMSASPTGQQDAPRRNLKPVKGFVPSSCPEQYPAHAKPRHLTMAPTLQDRPLPDLKNPEHPHGKSAKSALKSYIVESAIAKGTPDAANVVRLMQKLCETDAPPSVASDPKSPLVSEDSLDSLSGSFERMLRQSGLKARTKDAKDPKPQCDPASPLQSPHSPYTPSPTVTPRGVDEKWHQETMKDTKRTLLFQDTMTGGGKAANSRTPGKELSTIQGFPSSKWPGFSRKLMR